MSFLGHASPIGLVPAAGFARRLGRLPCSKEVLPVGLARAPDGSGARVQVACEHLLGHMQRAGVRRVHLVLRNGKWDIPAYLGSGERLGLDIAYHVASGEHGPAHSLDAAGAFLRDRVVMTGFPDLLFEPRDAFSRILEKHAATGADVVLGLFPTDRPDTMDVVEVDAAGSVRGIDIKPQATDLDHAWLIAVWGPRFTEFMHEVVRDLVAAAGGAAHDAGDEIHVGRVLQAALDEGLSLDSVTFPDGRCVDIGAPEDLMRVLWEGGAEHPGSDGARFHNAVGRHPIDDTGVEMDT